MKIVSKKQTIIMYIFTAIVYFISYITRVNYTTILVEISSAESISRSLLAFPITASFITYGLGQIISGWLGDRNDPFQIISLGLGISALMNMLLPFFPKPYIMTALWAINGFAQALIYPPLMKIASNYLSEQHYDKACLFVSVGSHTATLLMYLIAPAMIAITSWRFVFFFSFASTVVFLIIWQFYSKHIKEKYGSVVVCLKMKNKSAEKSKDGSIKTLLISSGLIIIMLAVIMQGCLRDGIATWMPAYLSDVFSLSNGISILTTVILPVFSIFSAYIILNIYNKLCRNELKLAGFTFSAAAAAIVLLLIFKKNILFSVFLLAFTSACSHAINFLLICLVPKRFNKYGRFSLVTGLINSCTYVGAAISTYGVATVSENYGWNITLCLWGMIALIGMICCFALKKSNKS